MVESMPPEAADDGGIGTAADAGHETDDGTAAGALAGRPLTEQVLDRLGEPRWAWIVLWSAVPLVSPFVFGGAVRSAGQPFGAAELLDYGATQVGLAFACLVLLWGGRAVERRAVLCVAELRRLATGEVPPSMFRGIGSRAAPVALTVVVALVVSANGLVTYGVVPPLAALPFLLVYLLPILGFAWVYISILVDVDRLGRRPLPLDLFPQDRTLGLGGLGRLASTGLALLLVAAAPVLLAGGDDPVTVGTALAVVALVVAAFVLSMVRLHLQMEATKARYVATTRNLYAEAYAPLRDTPTLTTLADRAGILGAAQALDERANALPTWPLDEATVRFVVVVVSSVVTSLVVRALFAAIGL